MIKKICIGIILFAVCKTGYANVGDTLTNKKFNRFFFAASGGLAVPVGKFNTYERYGSASFVTGNNYAAAPKLGFNGKIEVMYLLLKKLGLICTYYSSSNKANSLSKDTLFPYNPYGGRGGGSGVNSSIYKAKNWATNGILLGIAAHLKGDGYSINFKISGGWQQVKSPEIRIDGSGYWWNISPASGTYTFAIIQPSMTSYNFVLSGGADIRVKLVKKLGLIISADYLNSFASFNGNLIDQNGNKTPNSFTMQISLFLFNMGICYQF